MKILVTADIHGNIEALRAVLQAAKNEYEGFISLGDMIGYGPNPEECVTLLRSLQKTLPLCILLAGNHEAGLLKKLPAKWFNPRALRALKKTRSLLSWKSLLFIACLKPVAELFQNTLLVHGSPLEPLTEYLWGDDDETETALRYLSAEHLPYCFCGHTHCASVFLREKNNTYHTIYPVPDEEIALTGQSHILNPGSVGFPRFFNDHDDSDADDLPPITLSKFPAYFVLWDTCKNTAVFKEVRYDSRITNEKIDRLMR